MDRGELRRLLLDALPAGMVRWNQKVVSIQLIGRGRHPVAFAGGSETEATPLVGADGAWPRAPGVTLLGEAAHLMSPFAGEGANLAMLDGPELARALIHRFGNRKGALASYECDMFARSGPVAQLSAANLALLRTGRAHGCP